MNNPTTDFNEWLDSLGFDASSPEANTQAEQSAMANGDLPPEPAVQPVSFSEEDMDSLLAENGFAEPQYDEAEEVSSSPSASGFTPEEESDEEEERDNTERLVEFNPESVATASFSIDITEDLDAEEDADWDGVITSIQAVPVSAAIASEAPMTPDEATAYPHREPVLNTDAVGTTATTLSESSEGQQPLLTPNSPTISMDESTSRFSGTEWYDEMLTKTIMIAGCGGIGSNLAYQIARLKPYSMILYDDDTVELANMSGQLFKRSDIGKTKVKAVHDMITAYTNTLNVTAIPHRFNPGTAATDIMLCGFDSMEARKTYYSAWKRHLLNIRQERWKNCFFMDGRLTVDCLQVFCLTGEDHYNMNKYETEFLFDDSQAEAEVCSQKQTTYLACMIGSIMTNLFINWVANSQDPVIPYKLPFFTQYEAQHMIFKIEE